MVSDALERLADGERHSLAQLQIGEDQLQPLLETLDDLGVRFELTGDSLQIPGGIELLNHDAILNGLPNRSRELMTALEIHRTIDSTNSYLMERQLRQPCHGVACLAEQQRRGRGRRGREWVSPFGRNLYLSVAWQMSTAGQTLEGLSLAAGVCAVDALNVCGVEGVQLKWPNDLLYRGSKLGGILVEMTAPRSGVVGLVVGIGINLRMPADSGAAIDQQWTDLSRITGRTLSRNGVAVAVLDAVTIMLDRFPATGFRAFHERWEALDAYRDREVVLRLGDRAETGREAGVDHTGALKLMTERGILHFSGGEISVRPA